MWDNFLIANLIGLAVFYARSSIAWCAKQVWLLMLGKQIENKMLP